MPPDELPRSISRRAALRLGAGAGLAIAAAPYVARHGLLSGAVDLRDAELALTPQPSWPPPPIITRSQWGANEALRRPGQLYDAPVRKIIVHHTATPNDVTNYAGLCRNIFTNEVAGDYIDIAYNWLIDPLGRIYEGRWATNYPAGTAHTGELSGRNVRGGHALNYNASTIGVALMGNYQLIAPSAAMMNALVSLITWKCARWGLNPLTSDPYRNGLGTVVSVPNICGHRNVNSTACPGDHVASQLGTIRQRVATRLANTGYWIASSVGQVAAVGGVPDLGDTARLSLPAWIVGIASHPSGRGYWTLGIDGGVFTFGNARFFGSTGRMRLNKPVIGITSTPSGNGYWLVATDGGIFSFGDAKFHGSTGALRLTQPIVGMCARPQGDGYWMVGADGGVFAFGAAPFFGSAFGRMSSRAVAMASTTTGRGYLVLAADGSVYAFGDAPYLGGARVSGSAVGITGRIAPLA